MNDLYVLKEKFRNMKFMNLSPNADFYSKFQSQMTVMNQNILYITHEVDKIKKLLNTILVEDNAQKQVDDFYNAKTSPQTDTDDKIDSSRWSSSEPQ